MLLLWCHVAFLPSFHHSLILGFDWSDGLDVLHEQLHWLIIISGYVLCDTYAPREQTIIPPKFVVCVIA